MWIDDQIIDEAQQPLFAKIWIPNQRYVVLGRSNKAESEVNLAGCAKLGISVLKRYGGGGTVVLYPGCVVISLGAWVCHPFRNEHYFKKLNQAIINALAKHWPQFLNLDQNGVSDLVLGDRKVAGTSLFRSRQYLLYQASLLCTLDTELMQTCLHHPSKEPAYRAGRSHAEFLLGLTDIMPDADAEKTCAALQQLFIDCVSEELDGELVAPDLKHMVHLVSKRKEKVDLSV